MTLSVLQVVLVLLVAFIKSYDFLGPMIFIQMHMMGAVLVGIVLGDPVMGLMVGGTFQLMSMGVVGIGGSSIPDYQCACIVGTVVAITSGQGLDVGVAVGIAVGMLGIQLDVIGKILNGFVANLEQGFMERGEYKQMLATVFLSPLIMSLIVVIPTLVALLFGADAVNFIINIMPEWFTTGLSIAGAMLPVVGMATLLSFMPTKKFMSFVAIGYVLSAYLGLGVLPVAILGGAAAYEYYKLHKDGVGAAALTTSGEVLEDE